MSGHIWRGLTNLVKKFRPKPAPPQPKPAFDFRSECANPCGCRTPLKCFDKEVCQYGIRQ